MNKPQLIAETPRAGKWNHRFIAAPDGSLSDSEIAEIVTAARRNPQGDDYLAVSVETVQSVSGRTGKEILVLTGVDVKKLSETQHQQIVTQLEQRLADLATLVTEKINWDRDGQTTLVKRRELGEWEEWFAKFPTFVPERDKKVPMPSSAQLKWVAGVVGILLVLGLGIRTIIQMSEESAPTQNHHETELSKDEIPQNTPDAEQGNTLEAKNCIKFSELKQYIETFSMGRDGYNPRCQEPTRQLTTLDDFLKESCKLEIDEPNQVCELYSNNCLTDENTIQKLKEDFDEFNKCDNPS